ncbi:MULTISPECIES: HdaA/DnaA family protein [Rhodobacterales]|jgi:chromosomal replication initiation ATPase DnaA|uniref:HdaA/DnaA family protein n=1 Tax=Rhodobacterales TaxID=204455 RepID=UPI00237F01A8|nr:DnaA/Hda family protein [Phaeobacter gallaeciensis]MDE4142425.1 DnaA/Hda family protein [Phaeobacter gallaeciensis]MDE4150939.1 DnaA/Hda family protein [Phaeobacter gallaeciensis]MDE4155099.1 DnaA/Hda family protein [Phaeobacter gallaeciensis]MDE4230558.1 DnaA/Hda family protein [Phaeobacter gallaeciensis]MDE4259566.1 DnaA/Hda family protein [Phaeobacter gallaeciensis]
MAQQLSFDLPAKTALGRDDFFVAPSNAMAVALLDPGFSWPSGKLVLTGPAGSGKTHLAHVWASQSGARIVPAADLTEAMVPELATAPVVLEDVPQIASDKSAQEALFHLHNLVLANGFALMMTGRAAPNLWGLSLPDLQSRVQAATHAELQPPDDALLAVVLAKLFNDRQITPKPDVIPYLVAHMDRSFAAAARIVEQLDRLSLAEKRNLSRPLAVRLMSEDRSVAGETRVAGTGG